MQDRCNMQLRSFLEQTHALTFISTGLFVLSEVKQWSSKSHESLSGVPNAAKGNLKKTRIGEGGMVESRGKAGRAQVHLTPDRFSEDELYSFKYEEDIFTLDSCGFDEYGVCCEVTSLYQLQILVAKRAGAKSAVADAASADAASASNDSKPYFHLVEFYHESKRKPNNVGLENRVHKGL
ncbi:hypothetical protein GQ43DRAFT_104096 [Delitschia confertaspora ATCC 74209]|uniref:Uncharacterized protein n=1 Tax=Delitschia confertaspora ATCC 74209 TaxID=1513339 RepID=A0A9P4JKE7_9PLEO|nr:hypothetical protein GQ43DRAFT_104096 [Delitschia confertaspora ATCC 74209]